MEILTVIFIITATLAGLTSINDPSSVIGFLLSTGDCVVVGIIMCLLGLKCPKVHDFSLSVLIAVHGIFSIVQTRLLIDRSGYIDDYTNLNTTNQMMFRLTITASLIFLTNFRYYLYFCLPATCIPMVLTFNWTTSALQESEADIAADEEVGCDAITLTSQLAVHRDLFLILCVSIGIYSHNSALVGHYLLSKKTIR